MKSLWAGTSVFLTGHTGFKGAWLGWWLTTLGANVTGYALSAPEQRPSLFREIGLEKEIESRIGDIRDRDRLGVAMAIARPRIVFHLAAQALVRPSYADPQGTFETNVIGTANVLDAVRDCASVEAVVVITSDKCYLNQGLARGYVETDPLGGSDPYSASKAAQEIVSAAYRDSFFAAGPRLATVRAGNVIGGGDWAAERLVPDIIDTLVNKTPLVLRFPDAVRPWQHVLEPLGAYLRIGEGLLGGEADLASSWNIGPRQSDHLCVSEIVELFCQVWEVKPAWERAAGVQPHEAMVLRLDTAKAEALLNIRPRFDIHEACRRTADWYRGWSQGEAATLLCNADIAAFEARS